MEPITHSNSSAHFVESYRRRLIDKAVAVGKSDGASCADIILGMPTHGQAEILDELRTAEAQLPEIQRDELRGAVTAADSASAKAERLANWHDPDNVPEDAPPRSMRPVRARQGAVLAVLGTEAVLLIDPINESLRGGIGKSIAGLNVTPTGLAGAVTITALGAFMAHARAEANNRPSGRGRSVEDAATAANRATLGLMVAAAAAVVARIYAATVDRSGIDASGIAFYIMLQLAFFFVALTLPQGLIEAKRSISKLRIDDARDNAKVEHRRAVGRVDDLREQHGAQPAELAVATEAALNTYMGELAASHPDTFMGDLVRTQLARAHASGVFHVMVTGQRPPGGRVDGDARTSHDDHGDDGGDDGGDGTGDSGGGGGPSAPADADGQQRGAQQLLDDIFQRRAS